MGLVYFFGLIPLLFVLGWIGKAVHNRWVRKPTSWSELKGHWAVVTGASEGIGQSYAKGLAKRGLNIVIMARTKSKLDTFAQSLRDEFKVEARAIPFDFFSETKDYDAVAKELSELKVSVLVNNVGGSGLPGDLHTERTLMPYLTRDIADADGCLLINCRPTMAMTRIVGAQMATRKLGRIINVSSLVGIAGMPLSGPYSGTKAFIDAFTKSLVPELASEGIKIESHLPGNVSTANNLLPVGFDCCTPDDYTEWSLNMFGTGNVVVPYPFHTVMATAMRLAPEAIVLPIAMAKRRKDKQKALAYLQSKQAKSD